MGSGSAAGQMHPLTLLTGPRFKSGAVDVLPLTYAASGCWATSTTISLGPAQSSPSTSVPWVSLLTTEASSVHGATETHPPQASSHGGLGRSSAHLVGWPPLCCLLITPKLGTAWLATRQGSGFPASFLSMFATNSKSSFCYKTHDALPLGYTPSCPSKCASSPATSPLPHQQLWPRL